ncbi:MAG: hypothetical protein V4498_06445, partial [candidate division FCPU426 bacterium]
FALWALEAWRAWGNRAAFAVLAALSFGWGLCLGVLPWFSWGKHDGQNWPLKLLGKAMGLDLCAVFPSFIGEEVRGYAWVPALLLLGAFSLWKLGVPKAEIQG